MSHTEQTVLEYELMMVSYLREILSDHSNNYNSKKTIIKNALVESLLLHIRIICDIYTSKSSGHDDDITLNKIIKEIDLPLKDKERLENEINKLKKSYGNRKDKKSPCYIINKRLAHASNIRGLDYNYDDVITTLFPHLGKITKELNMTLKNTKIASYLEALSDISN